MEFSKTVHVRSWSDSSSRSLSSDSDHQSPTSVLPTVSRRRKLHRKSGSNCRSLTLTELELEELKGFKDLGFEFSDEDRKDPNLVSIVPGLRRLERKDSTEDVAIQRPYLSEAWEVMEKNEAVLERILIINRRLKEMGSDQNGMDMKEQIKLWARSVASAIR